MKKQYATIEAWVLFLLLIIQIFFITSKLTHTLSWSWLLIMSPLLIIVCIIVVTILVAFIKGVISAIKNYHTSKLYRISKLPKQMSRTMSKTLVDGFMKGYIENEFEEQLKNFHDRKDLN
jgi:ATP/ADP translocase